MLEQSRATPLPADAKGPPRTRSAGQPLVSVSPVATVATFLILLSAVLASVYQLRPPDTVPATAPGTTFSSARAMQHVAVIAQEPHPTGSPANDRVREYLLQTLTDLGLEPEVQRATAVQVGRPEAGSVQNIVARIRGSHSSQAVLIAAHYDSTPTSPGANDDGTAVGAILETLRILQAGPPLRNDLIVLLSDGEEAGTLGAKAFVDEHPWANDVAIALNFEARGSSGSVMMFEASEDNGWIIPEFARAAPRPFANSLSFEVYRRLIFGTDFTVFKEAGWSGLNFAYIDGATAYHTELDSLENLDERSLQHHGSYMLALTQHFGNLDLPNTKAANAIYFDLLQQTLVHYPGTWAVPLALLLALFYIGVAMWGRRRGQLTVGGVGVGIVAFLLAAATAIGAVLGVWWGVTHLYPEYTFFRIDTFNSKLYLISFVALAVALTSAWYGWLRRRVSVLSLWMGALFLWVVGAVASSLLLTGASYLFLWPPLFMLVAASILIARAKPVSVMEAVLVSLLAVPAIVLLVPTLVQLFVALGIHFAWTSVLVVMLLLGLLVPHLSLLARPRSWLLPAGATVAFVLFLVIGNLTARFDAQQPLTNRLTYAQDTPAGTARWLTFNTQLDEWTSLYLSEEESGPLPTIFPAFPDFEFINSEAPFIGLPAPEIEVLADRTAERVRTLRLRLTSPRGASALNINVTDGFVVDALVNGRRISDLSSRLVGDTDQWRLLYYGVPAEGIELELQVVSLQPWTLTVVDQSWGFPDIPGLQARPEYMIAAPTPYQIGDVTVVTQVLHFEKTVVP